MFNEASIEVAKSEEFLHLLQICWLWPFLNRFDLIWVHVDSVGTDQVSEKVDLLDAKFAFLFVESQFCLIKCL